MNPSPSKKLNKAEDYRSKDGVRAHVFASRLGGDDIVVIKANTAAGDDAEVVLNVSEVASLRDWLTSALPASALEPTPRHCEMEQEGESHDLAPGVICIACWNRVMREAEDRSQYISHLEARLRVESPPPSARYCPCPPSAADPTKPNCQGTDAAHPTLCRAEEGQPPEPLLRAGSLPDALRQQLADCEASLRIYDPGAVSEYWLRYEGATKAAAGSAQPPGVPHKFNVGDAIKLGHRSDSYEVLKIEPLYTIGVAGTYLCSMCEHDLMPASGPTKISALCGEKHPDKPIACQLERGHQSTHRFEDAMAIIRWSTKGCDAG
ncbi:MAG: hypothetical protein ACT4O5_08700 [Gammaproteobacteria bacterium]